MGSKETFIYSYSVKWVPGLLILKLKHLIIAGIYIIIHVNKIKHFLFSQRKETVVLNRMGVSKAIFKGKTP